MGSVVGHGSIRVVALGLFRNDGQILVAGPFDSAKDTPMYRPIGGGVELGETSEEALRREVREETGEEIEDLSLFKVLENVFVHDGVVAGHEVVFVYDCRFVDSSVYLRSTIEIEENDGARHTASWRAPEFFDQYHRLVPEALALAIA